ncbi:MAG: ABC transporter ATP-binding protein [Deltaproteobacteria bacterium]|nr:MAG: ABC transporter ATP-binding protein [Deltaproteobacteria bacterium]
MNQSAHPVVRIDRLSKIYRPKRTLGSSHSSHPVIALNQVSLDIEQGEIFGLVGGSGSGKTTLGRLLVKLEKSDGGKIYLSENDTTRIRGQALKAFRAKVQMIFQDPYQSLNPQLTIFDTVSEPLIIHKTSSRSMRIKKVRKVLATVGFSPAEDYFSRYPHELSGGQRQRVAIARAIVLNPEFIVADEPTSMLDATNSFQIFNILSDLRKKQRVTFLFITHSLAAANFLCDRIGVIYHGNLVEKGPARQIIRHPAHPYTKALLDALPSYCQDPACTFHNTLLESPRDLPGSSHYCPFFTLCREADPYQCASETPNMIHLSATHSAACFKAG